MDKRGDIEKGWEFLFNLIFVIAIIITLFFWINMQASGNAMKKQVLAKETCMLITESRPGTTIIIEHSKDLEIESKDSAVLVKQQGLDTGYLYDCYLKDNVHFSKKDNFTIIEIK